MPRHPILLAPTALAALLAACSPAETPNPAADTPAGAPPVATTAPAPTPAAAPVPPPAGPATAPVIAVDGEGLRLVDPVSGRTRPIAFGTAQAATLAALAAHGTPQQGRNADCPAGAVDYATWPDGLQLVFQDGAFAGWSLDGRRAPKLTTLSGVGIGSTRAAIAAANTVTVTEGSLGTEFAIGDMGGLLDGTGPQAKVTDLWAGVTCIAR